MTAPDLRAHLDRIAAAHDRGDYDDGSCCDFCGCVWPCDAVRLLAAVRACLDLCCGPGDRCRGCQRWDCDDVRHAIAKALLPEEGKCQ